ncbi:MAG: hypothetical protein V1732_03980 [Patescibacteria group bacterium]
MALEVIKIFEYDEKLINSNSDIKFNGKEIHRLQKLNENLKKIQRVKFDPILFVYRGNEAIKIVASSFVGVVKVGRKVIQILPKMARGTDENSPEYSTQAIHNLLYMLSYTKRLGIKETDLASLKRFNDNFFEVLIYLLAKNLLNLVKTNFHKQYVGKEDNLSYIKGKLQFNNHLKKNIINRSRFYLEFDEFSEDNLLNQILKYTIHLLIKATGNFNNLKMLHELSFIFSDITLNKIRISDFKELRLSRLNQKYEPILNLCKIFISDSSLELNADRINTFSFIFDMNVLFEEFIGEFIKRNFSDNNRRISLQKPIRDFVDDKIINFKSCGPVFKLRPDIQVYKNGGDDPITIIDTKYKVLEDTDEKKEGVAQSDLYQMNAYAKKYNCGNIVLLYPMLFGQSAKNIRFEIDKTTIIHVRTVNLCRDLKREKENLKNELAGILGRVQGESLYNIKQVAGKILK